MSGLANTRRRIPDQSYSSLIGRFFGTDKASGNVSGSLAGVGVYTFGKEANSTTGIPNFLDYAYPVYKNILDYGRLLKSFYEKAWHYFASPTKYSEGSSKLVPAYFGKY